jgi:hypothetical protein
MKNLVLIAAIALVCSAAPGLAFARHCGLDTNVTPIFIDVAPDGGVTGTSANSNPARATTFYGHMTSGGAVQGTWVQAAARRRTI